MSTSYTIGYIVGIMVTVVLVAVVVAFISKVGNKDGKMRTEYDERQKFIIGQGYKIAFWTLAGLLVLLQILGELSDNIGKTNIIAVNGEVLTSADIIISIMVFCVHNIWNGAYWGLNNNRKRYTVIIAVIGVINLIIGAVAIIRDNMKVVVDGTLTGVFVNLLCGILMIVVLATVELREYVDRKNGDGEEGVE